MSADPHPPADPAHAGDVPHGSMRGYAAGFLLSVVLTAIPFWLVMARPLPPEATAILIVALAAAQIVVHMVYFLHMSPRAESGWTMTALLFTIIIVAIMLIGSLWVMYHLNTNMMPMPHDPGRLP